MKDRLILERDAQVRLKRFLGNHTENECHGLHLLLLSSWLCQLGRDVIDDFLMSPHR